MVFTKPPRGRQATRSATIPVRRSGSKLTPVTRRLSAALPTRKSGTQLPAGAARANPDEKQNTKDEARDVRLVITRLADSVIKRHSSASRGRGGSAAQRIKVGLSVRSVEQALKSVPTLEDPAPPSAGTQPILCEYQIPNSNTAGSHASIATGPVPLEGRDRCTVETVLNDAALPPAPASPKKRQSVVSRLLHRTRSSTRSKSAKIGSGKAVNCAPKATEDKPTPSCSRSPSVVLLNELEVEYNTSLRSEPTAEKTDVATAPTEQDVDRLERSDKKTNSAGGWSLACAGGETESTMCEKLDVRGLVSRFTASFCGVVEGLTKKESPNHEPQVDMTPPAQDASIQVDPPLGQVPSQEANLVPDTRVVPTESPRGPSFPEELSMVATEQHDGATTEEDRTDADLTMAEVPTFLTEPLPTNSIIQGEFMTAASIPFATDDRGLEARDSDGLVEMRDGAADLTERVDSLMASTSAEAAHDSPKELNQVPKVKIVPLFGFMSGVIGQCYFVSLSPDSETTSGTDALAPEQRLLRFLEAAASCQPDQLPEQEQLAARELVHSLSPVNAADHSPSKEIPAPAANVGSIGLLRREGDEYFIDPLPSFNQGSIESNLTGPLERSAPDESRFQGLGCGDVQQTWDARASSLAMDAKQTLDSVLRTFTKQTHSGEGSDHDKSGSERRQRGELDGFLKCGKDERPKQVSQQPSLVTVESNQFLHGTYSWFAI